MREYRNKFEHLLNPGHTACSGCGEILAARHVIDAAGKNSIVANATGCLEVTTSKYPESSWKVPWIHSLFENNSAVATGILAALKYKKIDKNINVLAIGGDGSTFDIGFGLLSGMFDREDNILYVCFDNEAYMNTGYQGSGSSPVGANTTTSPPGKVSVGNTSPKKNMPAIAIAHDLPYVATATVGYPLDIQAKVKKALTFQGPKYVQILVPCVPGWGSEPNLTIKIAKLAQQTGLYPVYEAENGKVTKVMPFPATLPKVEEYLKLQKRFKHLFETEQGKNEIKLIQEVADKNILTFKF